MVDWKTKTVLAQALREAGEVTRCHTTPHHGRVTLAQHCYHMLCLLFVLHPEPPPKLVQAIMWHDAPERWLGDMPGPAKSTMGVEYLEAEQGILRMLGVDYSLNEKELWWLHTLDRIELLMWVKDQVALGNQHVLGMLAKLTEWFMAHEADMPEECWHFINSHEWLRLSDVPPVPKKEEKDAGS